MIAYEGIFYLELEDALSVYADAYGCTLGEAPDYLRSPGGLEGALNRPRAFAQYSGVDLPMQAALLVHGIAETQPFLDGNKRAAGGACTLFLGVNGYVLDATQDEIAAWIKDLAARPARLTEESLAERFRTVLIEG